MNGSWQSCLNVDWPALCGTYRIRGIDTHGCYWIGVAATGPCSSSVASSVAQVTGGETQRVKDVS